MLNADVAGAVGLLYIYYHAVYKAQQRPISLMVRTVDSDSTGPGSIPGLAFLPAFSSHANHAIPTPATRAHFLVRKREFGSNALREMKHSFYW